MKILISLAFLIVTISSYAAKKEEGYLLKVNFSYTLNKKAFKSNSEFILPKHNKEWTPLVPSKNGVALLGKIKPKKDGTLKLDFLVVDTKSKPTGLNSMSVITQLNDSAEIYSGDEINSIKISIVNKETNYTTK